MWTQLAAKRLFFLDKTSEDGQTDTLEDTHVKVHFAPAKLNTLFAEALFKVCMCLCVQVKQREEHCAIIR